MYRAKIVIFLLKTQGRRLKTKSLKNNFIFFWLFAFFSLILQPIIPKRVK